MSKLRWNKDRPGRISSVDGRFVIIKLSEGRGRGWEIYSGIYSPYTSANIAHLLDGERVGRCYGLVDTQRLAKLVAQQIGDGVSPVESGEIVGFKDRRHFGHYEWLLERRKGTS